ncbi:MAG TPA: hypothetical protein VGP47_08785 [Parachlamydiaceae bacterium]|nr:hypothetical protein [Parachlamydiaceae bacterium]
MRILCCRILMASALFLSCPVIASAETPPCYKQLEVNFFNSTFVNEALSLHSVSQSNWALINTELQNNLKQVPEMVKERAKKMDPNPFGTPFQPQEASKLLRRVLLEVFSATLANFQITNQGKVEEMFRYIRERQSQRLLSCFGQEEEARQN